MGAQQTYDWAVRFPDAVKRAAPIAGLAKGTPHNRLLVETFIEAITSDPAWDGGWYCSPRRGASRFATAREIIRGVGLYAGVFNKAAWQGLGFTTTEDFVTGFVENHFLPQDPNNLILLLSKWWDYDVSRIAGGSLEAALSRITAKLFVIAIENDASFH